MFSYFCFYALGTKEKNTLYPTTAYIQKGTTCITACVVVKAGYFRILLTASTYKKPGYYFPSSMMDSDWEELNTKRQRNDKTIFIFGSTEFVKLLIANHVGGNSLVPTEGLFRNYSSKTRVFKDEDDKERPSSNPRHCCPSAELGFVFTMPTTLKVWILMPTPG